MVKKAGFLLAGIVLLLLSISCSKSEDREHPSLSLVDAKPRPVVLSFDVFNHTQGFLKSVARKGFAGQTLVLTIAELEANGVDPRRIVIRKGRLGSLIACSRTGKCEFVVPESDTVYSVYLMNTAGSADYNAVDVRIGIYEGNLAFPREMKWSQEDLDGFQGPHGPLAQAVRQLDSALDYEWARYGRFIQVEIKEDSHFTVGYGKCRDQYGWHTLRWAGVNPVYCHSDRFKLETFLEEIFELVTGRENIAGNDTVGLITSAETGSLSQSGKDLLAYIFVKDPK